MDCLYFTPHKNRKVIDEDRNRQRYKDNAYSYRYRFLCYSVPVCISFYRSYIDGLDANRYG